MKYSSIAIMAVLFMSGMVGGTVLTSQAATNFNGSTITGIDESQRTITFRTRQGESWTLPVLDPELLKTQQISQGEQVSIEIDLNDQITRILKPSDTPAAPKGDREEPSQ